MQQIVNGLRYDTDKAEKIASDDYWDGSNHDRNGRNIYLHKTAKGNFFIHKTTRWQGERDSIEPVTVEEAKGYYEILPEHEVDYPAAFGEEPEEA